MTRSPRYLPRQLCSVIHRPQLLFHSPPFPLPVSPSLRQSLPLPPSPPSAASSSNKGSTTRSGCWSSTWKPAPAATNAPRPAATPIDGITRLIRDGLRIDKWLVASSCRSCSDPYCLVGCPVDAIHRDGQGKQIQIESHCIGCGICANNCPYGNINMHPRLQRGRTAIHGDHLRPLQLDRRPRQLAAA